MNPIVYLETTIISLITGRMPRDLISAAHQQETLAWWDSQRHQYTLVSSEYVIEEIEQGDPKAAQRRLSLIQNIPLLATNDQTAQLAAALIADNALPQKAMLDALHVAIATVNGVDFLLTWNCKHIANAHTRPMIERCCRHYGYEPPIICTPTELLGD